MPFNLVALLSSKKNEIPQEVKDSVNRAVAGHVPLEQFAVPACGVLLRNGVFFNNISQGRIVFELDRYSCPRGLRKGLHAICSFTLHIAEDYWDYHKFEGRIFSMLQSHGRTSLQLLMPQQFTQRHTRNGLRLPLFTDDASTLQIWRRAGHFPSHLSQLLEQPPLLQNGAGGNVLLLDIAKGGMGLMLADHGLSPAPEVKEDDQFLLRLVLPHSVRAEPLHSVLCARLARVLQRQDGRKTGLQFTHLAVVDASKAMHWHELDHRGVLPLARIIRERCERLKAGPLR